MKIEITNPKEEPVKEGIGRNQKPYKIREQEAWLHLDHEKYPQRIRIQLRDGVAPYPVGMYLVDDRSFYVGQYDVPKFSPVLKPVVSGAMGSKAA